MNAPSPTAAHLGQRIRQARIDRGWSQLELCARAGVSRPTVARIEAGHDVSTATLTKVARALGLVVELEAERQG